MQYSKNQQVRKNKKEVYGNKIPRKNAKEVIARSKNRCSFMYELFGETRTNCEIHHIFGRICKRTKHHCPNLIYINRDLHYAYHHQGVFEYNGLLMNTKELKQWFIEYNKRIYGEKEVEECRI